MKKKRYNWQNNSILIIENDQLNIFLLKKMFKMQGMFKIFIAHNFKKGIDILDEHEIDLIILDLFFLRENGCNLLDKLNQNNIKAPPIIVQSASSLDKNSYIDKYGFTDIFVKPLMIDDFLSAVDDVLRRK